MLLAKGNCFLKSIPEDGDSQFHFRQCLESVTPISEFKSKKKFGNILGIFLIVIIYFQTRQPNPFRNVIFNQLGQNSPASINDFFCRSIVTPQSIIPYFIVDRSQSFIKFQRNFSEGPTDVINWFLIFNSGPLTWVLLQFQRNFSENISRRS